MKYLNKKIEAYHVEVGDEVMFLSDFNEIAVGTQGVVVEKGETHVVVQVAPKTSYEQENASLRAKVTVSEEELNLLAFAGDLQEYEPAPKPEVKEEAATVEDEKKDGDDDTKSGDDTTANKDSGDTEKKDTDTGANQGTVQAGPAAGATVA